MVTGLNRPVFAGTAPGDPDRLFILEQRQSGVGRIKIFNLGTGTLNGTDFLTITGLSGGNEQGLLGLAFHPDYANNGLFYVNVTTSATGGNTVIREYQRTNADQANVQSARDILTFNQPFSNHNGGWMDFGPDGFLYIGSGDGGSGGDPGNNAQTITNNLLGKILRIDPLGNNGAGGEYGIPASNPFVGITGDDEIWAYGLRNPWRCSFDELTGDLYIGDVGQGAREEINVQPAASLRSRRGKSENSGIRQRSTGGENYGWRVREGTLGGSLPGAIDPVYDYSHGGGNNQGFSVTGGRVYRGPIGVLQGHYFFADYVTNRLWSFKWDGSPASQHNGTNFSDFIDWSDLITTDVGTVSNISSFGTDASGNLCIVCLGGDVFRVTGATIPTLVGARKALDGIAVVGGNSDLNESDDEYLSFEPSPTSNPFKQNVDVLLQAIANSASPDEFSFRLEARMIGGPAGDVFQEIRLLNYQTGQFELVDTRDASVTDQSTMVSPTGNVSRFIKPGTLEMTARVSWASPSFAGTPFTWMVDIDEIVWPVTD